MSTWRKVGYCLVAAVCSAAVASAQDDTAIPNGIYVSATADGSVAHDCTYADPGTLKQGVAKIANNSVLVLMRGAYDIPAMFTNPTKTDGAYDYIKLTGKSGVTIRSIDNDPDGTVLYGDGSYGSEGLRLLYSSLQNSTYCGLTVSNFYGNWGGAITFHGGETISNCIFRCNKSKGIGGACRNGGKYVKCDFVLNVAEADSASNQGGGALYQPSSVISCTFRGNSALRSGGAIYSRNLMSVSSCHFYTNSARNGGGLYSSGANVAVTDCHFEGNQASWGGGAVQNDGAMHVCATNSWFVGNTAKNGSATYGGEYYKCKFLRNFYRSGSGDGVVSKSTCEKCLLAVNETPSNADNPGSCLLTSTTVRHCCISNNTGGTAITYQGTVSDSFFIGNTLTGNGGPNQTTLKRCIFTNNTAKSYVCLRGGSAYSCLYVGNKITDSTACHANWGSLYNCTFIRNEGGAAVVTGLTECYNNLYYGQGIDVKCGETDKPEKFKYCHYQHAQNRWGQDLTLPGEGCLKVEDPRFALSDEKHPWGYGLRRTSPCRNSGINLTYTASDLDCARMPRIAQGTVDIGCYEYWPNSGLALILK